MFKKYLTFRIEKDEYIRLSKIVSHLANLSCLSEIQELNDIVTKVSLRHFQDGIDEYFDNNKIKSV